MTKPPVHSSEFRIALLLILAIAIIFPFAVVHGMSLEDLSKDDMIHAIESVEQVKEAIRKSIQKKSECGAGSCDNYRSQQVCELIGALDVKTNGAIIGQMTSVGMTGMCISERDLELMKLILQQCKPTNYQYWNFDSILHVGYLPSPEAGEKIGKMLGVESKKSIIGDGVHRPKQ
jgi:hypothetical protein